MGNKVKLTSVLPEYNDLYQGLDDELTELFSDIDTHSEVNLETLEVDYALLFELDFKILASLILVWFSDDLAFELKEKKDMRKLFLEPKQFPEIFLATLKEDIEKDDSFGKKEALFLLSFFINLMLALWSNIKAVSVYGYTKTICELIAKARDDKDLKALFDAIVIDKACLNTPTAQKAVYDASITGDNDFFDKLSRAIKGSRPRNQKPVLDNARFMDALIQDWKDAEPLTNEEICRIFIDELKIYPNTGEDSYAGLTRLLQRLRKNQAT
jgi:hypothetical protein